MHGIHVKNLKVLAEKSPGAIRSVAGSRNSNATAFPERTWLITLRAFSLLRKVTRNACNASDSFLSDCGLLDRERKSPASHHHHGTTMERIKYLRCPPTTANASPAHLWKVVLLSRSC